MYRANSALPQVHASTQMYDYKQNNISLIQKGCDGLPGATYLFIYSVPYLACSLLLHFKTIARYLQASFGNKDYCMHYIYKYIAYYGNFA